MTQSVKTSKNEPAKKPGRPKGSRPEGEGITVRVYKHGGSLGVLIPRDFADFLGMLPDRRFRLTPCGDELVLSPADKPSNVAKALLTLFKERTE
jgi:antitoxin component of MazEF toxin-antitoxin module